MSYVHFESLCSYSAGDTEVKGVYNFACVQISTKQWVWHLKLSLMARIHTLSLPQHSVLCLSPSKNPLQTLRFHSCVILCLCICLCMSLSVYLSVSVSVSASISLLSNFQFLFSTEIKKCTGKMIQFKPVGFLVLPRLQIAQLLVSCTKSQNKV